HEVLDRARDQHLAGSGSFRDPSADVHGDPADLPVDHLALTGMEAGANLETELVDGLRDRSGAANRPCGPVERRKETVTGGVQLGAPEAGQQAGGDAGVAL